MGGLIETLRAIETAERRAAALRARYGEAAEDLIKARLKAGGASRRRSSHLMDILRALKGGLGHKN